jgi:hypothetical protein
VGYARAGSSPAFGTIITDNLYNDYREIGLTAVSLFSIWATFFRFIVGFLTIFLEVLLGKGEGASQSFVNITSWPDVIHINDIIGLIIPKDHPQIPGTYSMISGPFTDHVLHIGLA